MKTIPTYAAAKNACVGRLNKITGRKIHSGVWLRPVKDKDAFELIETIDTWGKDEKGRYTRLPKAQWKLRAVAIYTPTGIELCDPHWESTLKVIGVTKRTYTKQKFLGAEWTYMGTTIRGEGLPFIKDGVIQFGAPQRERDEDNDARNKLNAHIKRVRNALRVRQKLGAFNSTFVEAAYKEMPSIFDNKAERNVWSARRCGNNFFKALKFVDIENLDSFKPLLWLINPARYYNSAEDTKEIPKLFDRRLNGLREKIKRAAGVVRFVDASTET